MQTVLGTFNDRAAAQRAVDQLIARGFSRASVHMQTASADEDATSSSTSDQGMMGSVGHFFSKLFESDDKSHAGNYAEVVRRGSSVVAVDANDDAEVDTAQSVMQQLGTVNVDDQAALVPNPQLVSSGAPASEGPTASVVEEELVVGKRTLDMGGLRVVKRMSETPVSEIINLRQEKATIERKPVDREATEADFANFKEGTFEVRETAEEAVVGKTARVVEEVSIGKDVSNRSETVSDTVRRTDVDVERLPGTLSRANSDVPARKS